MALTMSQFIADAQAWHAYGTQPCELTSEDFSRMIWALSDDLRRIVLRGSRRNSAEAHLLTALPALIQAVRSARIAGAVQLREWVPINIDMLGLALLDEYERLRNAGTQRRLVDEQDLFSTLPPICWKVAELGKCARARQRGYATT